MITEGFTIKDDPGAVGGKTITCHKCGMTSYHPKDVEHRYCGKCNDFHAPPDGGLRTIPRRGHR